MLQGRRKVHPIISQGPIEQMTASAIFGENQKNQQYHLHL